MVDVDLKSYFDTISHELLLELVERRVGDVQVLRLIRAWLKAGVMEEGKVTHPDRGSPQGGVISPTLSNIFLHEVDRQWCLFGDIHDKFLSRGDGDPRWRSVPLRLVRRIRFGRTSEARLASRPWFLRSAEPDIHLRSLALPPSPKNEFGFTCRPRNN
jgi:reverse transcriptase-like protein